VRAADLSVARTLFSGIQANKKARWEMIGISRRLVLATVVAALSTSMVHAQQPQTMRVRGTIEKLDGNVLAVKSSDGAALNITLVEPIEIVGVVKASLAEIKEGTFMGSAAMPQADGTQKALEIHIFPESMRGRGEGHRPYTIPNSTMTNGTAGVTVANVDGGRVTLKYKDGEKTIIVSPETPIVRYEIGDKSDLKSGAAVTILSATKKPDGALETTRVNVGRNGAVPQ
jgi:hypothetical protein